MKTHALFHCGILLWASLEASRAQTPKTDYGIHASELTEVPMATLVDGEMPAGKHAMPFTPREITTGLYFYQLTAGKFSQTRKAVLLK